MSVLFRLGKLVGALRRGKGAVIEKTPRDKRNSNWIRISISVLITIGILIFFYSLSQPEAKPKVSLPPTTEYPAETAPPKTIAPREVVNPPKIFLEFSGRGEVLYGRGAESIILYLTNSGGPATATVRYSVLHNQKPVVSDSILVHVDGSSKKAVPIVDINPTYENKGIWEVTVDAFVENQAGRDSKTGSMKVTVIVPPRITATVMWEQPYLGEVVPTTVEMHNSGSPANLIVELEVPSKQAMGKLRNALSIGADENVTHTYGRGPTDSAFSFEDIGLHDLNIVVKASNKAGEVTVPINGKIAVSQRPVKISYHKSEYSDRKNQNHNLVDLIGSLKWFAGTLSGETHKTLIVIHNEFVEPSSPTVKAMADSLISRHPNDQELQVKEIYYYARDYLRWVEDPDSFLDFTKYPVETIVEGVGDCDDQAVLIISLLGASGFKTKLVQVPGHVYAMVYLPQSSKKTYSGQYADWIGIDPTCKKCMFGALPEDDYNINDILDTT